MMCKQCEYLEKNDIVQSLISPEYLDVEDVKNNTCPWHMKEFAWRAKQLFEVN